MIPDSNGRLHGKVATYREKGNSRGRKVFSTNHILYANGGLSNWVDFRYINSDGTLGKNGGDYDYKHNFINVLSLPRKKKKIIIPQKLLK